MRKVEFILNLIVDNTERFVRALTTLFCIYLAYNWVFQSEMAASLLLLGVIIFFVYPITYFILSIIMTFVEFIAGIILGIIEYIDFDKNNTKDTTRNTTYDSGYSYQNSDYGFNHNQDDGNRDSYYYRDDAKNSRSAAIRKELHNALTFYGLSIPFSEKELREKRKELMKLYHPDAGGTDEDAKKINKYFDVLKKFASSNT